MTLAEISDVVDVVWTIAIIVGFVGFAIFAIVSADRAERELVAEEDEADRIRLERRSRRPWPRPGVKIVPPPARPFDFEEE